MNVIHASERFLVWVYDPCRDGGWQIVDRAYTIEEAEAKCRAVHEKGVKAVEDAANHIKEIGETWSPKEFACYEKSMVTANATFELES